VSDDLSVRLIDAIQANSGRHPGYRAAHAKGVLCGAEFTPSRGAAALTTAAHFAGDPVHAHVRFSNGSGHPDAHDGARDGRGMAVKFYLPDGTTTDIVSVTLPAFAARTPEDLLVLTEARRPDPATGRPDPDKIGAYLAAHPEALPAIQAAVGLEPTPSYAVLAYNALHAFWFVDAAGTRRPVRYHWVPQAHADPLTDEDALARDRDYLAAEMGERLAAGPVVFDLVLEIGADGDPTDDPTAMWPDDRDRVDGGRLSINALAFDREQGGDILVFDPTRVTAGIEVSGDPILLARSGAYRESVARRTAPG
jgi:catalase